MVMCREASWTAVVLYRFCPECGLNIDSPAVHPDALPKRQRTGAVQTLTDLAKVVFQRLLLMSALSVTTLSFITPL